MEVLLATIRRGRSTANVVLRAHIDKDLEVYVCLSEQCADPVKFFDNSSAWLSHMLQEHGATWPQNIHLGLWYCDQDHDDGTKDVLFSNVMEFDAHLAEIHTLAKQKIEIYKRRKRRRGDVREAGTCPFCETKPESRLTASNASMFTGETLPKHIATHLRSLAMLSLPGLPDSSEDVGTEASTSITDGEGVGRSGLTASRVNQLLQEKETSLVGSEDDLSLTEETSDSIQELDPNNAQLLMILSSKKTASVQEGTSRGLEQSFRNVDPEACLSLSPNAPSQRRILLLQICHLALDTTSCLHFVKNPSLEREELLGLVSELQHRWWHAYTLLSGEDSSVHRPSARAVEESAALLGDYDVYHSMFRALIVKLRRERESLKSKDQRLNQWPGAFISLDEQPEPEWIKEAITQLKHGRQEIPIYAKKITHLRESYNVGIICALEVEKSAVEATLDEEYGGVEKAAGDDNSYTFGRIGNHNVVVACLPVGVMGKISAAVVAKDMMRSFPIKVGLMVGICSGVWSERADVRLGDVVVSQPDGMHGGVVQWDYGKMERDGLFRRTGTLSKPPRPLLDAVQTLKARHRRKGNDLHQSLQKMLSRSPYMAEEYGHPGVQYDELFEASYNHVAGDTCDDCERSRIVQTRPWRRDDRPHIHYGNIASSDKVPKDGPTRDRISREEGILCFEIEAAGLMDSFPCVVIRGVCDYADSHKNKRWQPYAAATAACYAKELLGEVGAVGVDQLGPMSE